LWSAENHSPHCNLAEGTGPTTGDVTLRQLPYFAVLGEELNYRRAAERLFITQPALSTAISSLSISSVSCCSPAPLVKWR
jgi:hypothetical protein